MLNWLRKKARVTLQSRYNNILGRNNHSEMILTEQNMVNPQVPQSDTVKILIYNVDGEEYSLEVPQHMTIEKIKAMSIGHFFSPLEAVGRTADQDWSEGLSSYNSYRLVLTRAARTLLDENSVSTEKLLPNDELVLLECRKNHNPLTLSANIQVTPERIAQETSQLTPKNHERNSDFQMPTVDFKIALRKILLTLVEVSVHLISSEDDCIEIFMQIFEQLEKKHKPRVDTNSLKQLTEMGFPKARATQALFLKRTVPAAMDWLLDESNVDFNDIYFENTLHSFSPEQLKEYFLAEGKDPADSVMEQLNAYIKRWFQPEAKAVQFLKNLGYGEEVAKEALRASFNNEMAARCCLEGDKSMVDEIQKGFPRDSPVMLAILESPIVQLALSKPKILFALMVLCENPSNANVWLSDPETHPVVSQILKIYHTEKHRLCNDSDYSFILVNQTQSIPVSSATNSRETYILPFTARQAIAPSIGNTTSSSPVSGSPTISTRDNSSSPNRRRIRRVQQPSFDMPFLPSCFQTAPSYDASSSPSHQSIESREQTPPIATNSEVTQLTLTYIPPTTEGGLPTFTVRLEPSASNSQNLDVDMADGQNSSDMDQQ